jgi:hypothetical protein
LFTVFGRSPIGAGSATAQSVIRQVTISTLAPVYGVQHVVELAGIDHLSLFRDLDTVRELIPAEFPALIVPRPGRWWAWSRRRSTVA